MPYVDLHTSKPFDEGTLTKLSIFEQYTKNWVPTFIMQNWVKEINIVDLFSGPGYDKDHKKGSPLLILGTINYYFDIIKEKNKKVNLFFNEFILDKYENLKKNCEEYFETNKHLKPFIKIEYHNKDFNDIYIEIITKTSNHPSLYILDQNGIKFLNIENFKRLIPLQTNDFLFFVSSSYLNRFKEDEKYQSYLEIDIKELKSNPYKFIHRTVLNKYRSVIPENSDLKLFPFSIRKGANIYGIIFGSKHIRGIEKFLDIAWRENQLNGQANYDIEDDMKKLQGTLNFFNEKPRVSKINSFKNELESYIIKNKVVTNKDIYYFTYERGHIRKHADEKLKELKKKNLIDYSGQTKISWEATKKELVYFKLK